MIHVKSTTARKLNTAFGFPVVAIGMTNFEAHGERRTIYTVKRPTGSKTYRAVQYANGMMIAV